MSDIIAAADQTAATTLLHELKQRWEPLPNRVAAALDHSARPTPPA